MRRIATLTLVLLVTITSTGCGSLRMFGSGNAASARDSAAKALNMTTKAGVAIMTLAGAAYQAGAWGAPGSPRAEDVRSKLEGESVRLSTALTAWADALEANKDTGPYELVVATALAVITALLPPKTAVLMTGPEITDGSQTAYAMSLACPETYMMGGSR